MKITWLGHASFLLEFGGGETLLLDPWLEGNPTFAKEFPLTRVDAIAITHGHFDHWAGFLPVAQKFQAPVITNFELGAILQKKGLEKVEQRQKGGTADLGFCTVTLVNAFHSSSVQDGDQTLYAGEPVGFVIKPKEDGPVVYFAGDTCVFGDMAIIADLYKPEIAILPIGGHFTMDPHEAAYATKLLKVRRVIPMHFGTFPVLTGTPEHLSRHLGEGGASVATLTIGKTQTF